MDTVRSEATASQFIAESITAAYEDGTLYYDVNVDTDAADYFAVRLTYDRGFDREKAKAPHSVHLQEIKYVMNLSTVTAENLKVYEINGTTETVRLKDLPVDTTATTLNWASGRGVISAGRGNDIVVKIDDGGNLADAAANYLRITGLIK